MWKKILLIVCVCFLTACQRSPDSDTISAELQSQLNQAFGEQAIQIESLSRRGSSPDHSAMSGETRRVIYFDVSLRLKKDITLKQWEETGGASLVSLLGAGPNGVRGLLSEGNRAGDLILANASAVFSKNTDGQWELYGAMDFTPQAPVEQIVINYRPPILQEKDRLINVLATLPETPNALVVLNAQRQLRLSTARVQASIAQTEQRVAIASGPEFGEYYSTARAMGLAGLKVDAQPQIIALQTDGSIDNIHLLREGSVQFALAQADTAWAALKGDVPFAVEGPFSGLQAVAKLYPEVVHIVVGNDSSIQTLDDLRGKTIALGSPGGAVYSTITGLLRMYGLEADRDYRVSTLSFDDATQAIKEGKLDATANVIGLPAMGLRKAMLEGSFRLLPVPLMSSMPYDMAPYVIPANTYRGQAQAISTVSVAALLLTRSDAPDSKVEAILQQLYLNHHDFVSVGGQQAIYMNLNTARSGLTVPLHRAAERFYDQQSQH